jgi:hypothetical protein
VNYGAHTKLPEDNDDGGLAHALTLLEKKRTTMLRLYRKESSDESSLVLSSGYVEITSPFRPQQATSEWIDQYAGWLTRLCDAVTIQSAHATFFTLDEAGSPTQRYDLASMDPLPRMFEWIVMLGPQDAKAFAFGEMEKLPRLPGLDWLRTLRTKRNLIMILGPRVDQIPTDEQQAALRVAIANVLWNGCARTRGFKPIDLVCEIMTAPLAKHGFERVRLEPLREAQGEVFFSSRDPSGARAILVETANPTSDDMSFNIKGRHVVGKPDVDLSSGSDYDDEAPADGVGVRTLWVDDPRAKHDFDAKTEKQARASLKVLASEVEKQIMPWFIDGPRLEAEEAAKRAKKKRR